MVSRVLHRLPGLLAVMLVFSWLLAMPAGAGAQLPNDPATDQAITELYTEARFLILDEEYQRAYDVVQQCLITARPAKEAICLQGAILERLGKRGEAMELYRELLAKNPSAYSFLHFDLAYLYINAEKYQEALAQFRQAEAVDYKRAVREQALLYLRLKDYKQAEAQLERLPPGDPGVYYLRAQSLMYQRKWDQALQMVKTAQAAQPDKPLAKDLNGLASQIEAAKRANRRARAWLTMAADYNDNVFLDPLTDNPALVEPREEGDFSWMTRGVLLYRFTEGEDWALFGTAGFLNKSYLQLVESDFANLSGSVYFRLNGEKWLLRVPYHYAYYFSGASHQSRLQQYSIFPSLKWDMTEHITTYVHGLLQRRLYFTNESNIWRWSLRLEHLYYFGTQTKFLKLSYGVSQDQADNVYSGFTCYQVGLAAARPVWGALNAEVGLVYAYYQHETRPELGGDTTVPWDRADHQFRAYATLRYRPNDRWELLLSYFFTNNDSNVSGDSGFDPYNYRQNIISFMVVVGL
ncbi:MAG: tetratricopeptide repeat protein [Desulfarculaceae bacterium]|nr:tetratricopeptide repeat protein [Desulfarculaceae bacterium]MCF8074148.1 tetratricopeptide repeat protein [Desulfarculaceae bacterium]MCF8103260.1 tetratricopeptide repeat protein [Desulfarculaceae bacterium]MCF8116882.1 tetratricopeptide repeat protein [Desulfarculaceae bacterium]